MTTFGLPRPSRISRARAWMSGRRASSSKLCVSIEIGKWRACTVRTRLPCATSTRGPARATRDVVVDRHVDGGALRRVAEQPAHGAGEVARVGRALEADDVGAEEALDDLGAPRQLREDAVCRERNVVEETDREVGSELAQHLGHELQLVVLHPDRAVGRGHRGGALREALVDPHVGLPPLAVVRGRRDHVVVERPEGVVRESLVVVLDVVGAERDGTMEMSSCSNGSDSSSATPAQPTQAPSARCMTGSSAVTSPPGEVRHSTLPSAWVTLSTGSLFETTTRS